MRRTMTTILATALFVGVMAAPASASHRSPAPTQTITEIVIEASGGAEQIGKYDDNGNDYDVLREAVIALGLADALNGGKWTVFAPTDAAFEALAGVDESQVVGALVGSLGAAVVKEVVLYHAIAGEALSKGQVFYKRFWRTKTFTMADSAGSELDVRWFRLIDGTGNKVRPVWKATNIKATNGYIHTISEVLLPFAP